MFLLSRQPKVSEWILEDGEVVIEYDIRGNCHIIWILEIVGAIGDDGLVIL